MSNLCRPAYLIYSCTSAGIVNFFFSIVIVAVLSPI
jgi:hypothetical protein